MYLKKCECDDILHCQCPPEDKCDIMLADFDSLEPYLSSCYSSRFPGVIVTPAGTRYYRSPEVYFYSFTSLFRIIIISSYQMSYIRHTVGSQHPVATCGVLVSFLQAFATILKKGIR